MARRRRRVTGDVLSRDVSIILDALRMLGLYEHILLPRRRHSDRVGRVRAQIHGHLKTHERN